MTTSTATASRTVRTAPTNTRPALWRPALASGVAAAAVTTTMAAVLHAAGVSLEIDGAPIPAAGFANLTLMCVALGYVLAVTLRRFARTPHHTFVVTTIALTVASFIPDVIVSASLGTRFSLMAMHVVAAAIVIPAIASRLSDQRR